MLSGNTGKYKYGTKEDIKEICFKCKQAYFGDFLPQDCEKCIVLEILRLCEDYAWTLTIKGV